jgi:hypothetical protein
MCWNADVSLNTFIIAFVSLIIVVFLNKMDRIDILISLSISIMQLFEYFTWKNIHNKKIIYYLSLIAGPLIILSQILLINYGFLRGTERIIAFVLIFIVCFMCMIYNYYNNKFDMKVGENGHLIWYWADVPPILLLFMFIFYLYPLSRKENKFSFITASIFLLISLYYYYKYKTWGTMWCYFSNLVWMVLIVKSIYLYF